MTYITGQSFGGELAKLWGLENCRDIKIHIPVNDTVKITVELYGTKEQMASFRSIIKRYRLEEI